MLTIQLFRTTRCIGDAGVAPEREVYFWVYMDLYKWSLLTQGGKLALLINVFADSSFSRRKEYVFRNKVNN